MTTAVTIDAHAGWPVTVVTRVGEPGSGKSVVTTRVEPHNKHTVYLHSGCEIISVQEHSWEQPVPAPAPAPEPAIDVAGSAREVPEEELKGLSS